jgi:hypothetical protein
MSSPVAIVVGRFMICHLGVGVIALVTVLIISSLRPPGPGPANMQSDGIKIGEGLVAERTPALLPDELPVP